MTRAAAARPPAPVSAPASAAGIDRWAPAALVLLALALRLYGIQAGLPQVYEEAYPFKMAWPMWGWGPGRGLDLNPHWFRYPGLTLDLQFLGQGALYLFLRATGAVHSTVDFRILQQVDKTPFYLVGRSITAVLGALTVLPVYALARRVAGTGAAIAAALLVALSPALVAKSQVIEVDVPLTLFVAWGLLAAVDLASGLTRRRAIVMGIVTGLAATAKYPGMVLAASGLLGVVLGARAAQGPRAREAKRARRIAWPAAAGTSALAFLATAFATSPYLFLDSRSALADLAVEREHMRLGHFGSDLGSTWLTYVRDWFTATAGWPLALASLAGLVVFLGMRRRAWAMVLGAFVVAYAALVSSFAMKADRYLLPLIPAACVFAAALVAELCARARTRWAMAGATAVLALPALLALPSHVASLRPDTRTLARTWFEANVPAGAFVACEQYGPPLPSPLELQAVDRDLMPVLEQRGYRPTVYAVISVPLFQVDPGRSSAFYDPALYRVADAFVVTSAVRDRYRAEPARFAAQLALYDSLASSWPVWQRFPANGGPGPEIVVYRNPSQSTVFAQRRPTPGDPPMLRPGTATGGEAYFYYNVGLNYELFGFAGSAFAAYVQGIRSSASDPASATACAERAAGVLVRAGRNADAAALLDHAASEAPRPADAARLRALRDQVPAAR